MDVYSTVPISFAIATLGGEVLVDTLDSRIAYTIKPGTQTDTRVVLKRRGIPNVHNKDQRGDHYVTFVVQVPDHISHEAKELLMKFDELTGDSLHAVERATEEKKDTEDPNKDTKKETKKKKKFF